MTDDVQIQRMVKAHEDGVQGGMAQWDSNVFEDYYGANTMEIINGWAAINGMEAANAADSDEFPEQDQAAREEEDEDDGTNDFEEYYSEGKKRNKIHELFGFGKKKKEKLNPDGSVCKSCKVLKWATSDNQVQGYEDRFGFKMRWYGKGKGPRMPDDEEYMRGWKKGEEYDAGSQRSKEAGTHDALYESKYGVVVGQTVTHQQEPERGKGKVVAVDNKSAQPVALVMWEGGQQQRHDPRVLKPEGGYAVREGGMSDIHIEIQDALSEIMEQYGVSLEDIEGVIGDMKSDQDHGEWDEADQDHADQEYAAKHGDPWDAAVNEAMKGAPPKILNTLLVDRLEEVKERIGKAKEYPNDIWRVQVDQARDEVFPEGEQGAPESEFSPASFNKGTQMRESQASPDQWHDALLDWIYEQLPDGDLESATPVLLTALQDTIETISSTEANPHDGGMYGEEEYNETLEERIKKAVIRKLRENKKK